MKIYLHVISEQNPCLLSYFSSVIGFLHLGVWRLCGFVFDQILHRIKARSDVACSLFGEKGEQSLDRTHLDFFNFSFVKMVVTNFWSRLRPNRHHRWIQKVSKPLFPYKVSPFFTTSIWKKKYFFLGHTTSKCISRNFFNKKKILIKNWPTEPFFGTPNQILGHSTGF